MFLDIVVIDSNANCEQAKDKGHLTLAAFAERKVHQRYECK